MDNNTQLTPCSDPYWSVLLLAVYFYLYCTYLAQLNCKAAFLMKFI